MFLSLFLSLSHTPALLEKSGIAVMLISGCGMHAAIYIYTHSRNTPKNTGRFRKVVVGAGVKSERRRGREKERVGRRWWWLWWWGRRRLSPQHTTDVSANHLIHREVKEKVALSYGWMIPYAMCPCPAKAQDIDTYFIAKGASVPHSDSASLVPALESHEDSLSQKCLSYCAHHPIL